MEPEKIEISDERIYWVEIVITLIFGISTLYIIQFWPHPGEYLEFFGALPQYLFMIILYVVVLL
jgi:hypothetical protein